MPLCGIASSATPKASGACGELATAKGRQREAPQFAVQTLHPGEPMGAAQCDSGRAHKTGSGAFGVGTQRSATGCRDGRHSR